MAMFKKLLVPIFVILFTVYVLADENEKINLNESNVSNDIEQDQYQHDEPLGYNNQENVYDNESIEKRAPLDRSSMVRFGKRAQLDRAMVRFGRSPMDRSSMVRFGRAPLDRSSMVRFGRAPLARTSMVRFGKRAPLDRSSMVRFGKRAPLDRAMVRFGKRAPLDRAMVRFGKRFE
uniref:Uncharacterized protein n=1 Tax=Parastrongyloides trichosuri TaxID=131310 RepID=A0A0N5A455_PARTI